MTELTNLQIDEVSLVDAGANPRADIMFFKRREPEQPGTEQPASNPTQPAPTEPTAEMLKAQATVESLIATLQTHVNKIEDAEALAIAKKYEVLGFKAEELAAQLRSLKQFPELHKSLIKSLETSLAAVKKSQAFEEVGKSGRGTGTAKVEEIAREIQKRKPSLTWREAIHKAYMANPELRQGRD